MNNKFIQILLGLIAVTAAAASPVLAADYYAAPNGNDANTGSLTEPWLTMKKAAGTLQAGDKLFVRAGEYTGVKNGWIFANSGTADQPIIVTNYPGEQAVFKMLSTANDSYIFKCWINPHDPDAWQTPKADYIRILGTDVPSRALSNSVTSSKGIVMLGGEGAQAAAINAAGCDRWEVTGVDFIEVANGIFTRKYNWGENTENSPDYWNIHDNRVYIFYRESGIQLNGSYNVVENNEIKKATDRNDTTYGCQMLNLLGNNNKVRGNIFSGEGSSVTCTGLLFEWDLSDANLIENNTIENVATGIDIAGGDNNIIKNNILRAQSGANRPGVLVRSYENTTAWPCNDYAGSGFSAETILPPNDPGHPDYQYYFPHDCRSKNNQILGNTISGFSRPFQMTALEESSNIFSETSPDNSPSPSPSAPAGKAGDANGDNQVDGVDYTIWLNHYGQTVGGAGNGDFNNNGIVDGVDYVIWLNHYGN